MSLSETKTPASSGDLAVRDARGRFVKGSAPLQRGRIKGSKNASTRLWEALCRLDLGEQEHQRLLEYACERAYKSNRVLMKIIDKLIPCKPKPKRERPLLIVKTVDDAKEARCTANESST